MSSSLSQMDMGRPPGGAMASNQLKPTKYKVLTHKGMEKDTYYVVDMQNTTVCECSKIFNAKLICNLLEKFT